MFLRLLVCSLALAGGIAQGMTLKGGGTTVVGDEAREVFNTLIAAGATRTDIPEGPTVIIDDLRCVRPDSSTANCLLAGDPKLTSVTGPLGLRLFNAMAAMGVTQKAEGATLRLGVTGLDCGILHNVGTLEGEPSGEASCFFVDSN